MKFSHRGFSQADYETLRAKPYDELNNLGLLEILIFNTEADIAKFIALELHMRLSKKEEDRAEENKALEALKVLKEFLK